MNTKLHKNQSQAVALKPQKWLSQTLFIWAESIADVKGVDSGFLSGIFRTPSTK